MKRGALAIGLIFYTVLSHAQQVKPVKYEKLHQLINAITDTTYVINFWATWCAPCVKELPNFIELQKQYKADKLKVLLVSMDFRSKLETSVEPFVEKRNIPLEVYLLDEKDQGSVIDKIDESWSGALPGTLIINNNQSYRKFYERDFTYDELQQAYLSSKK
ncbi:TlpA family protein disulfide reductase [Solitalea sp. MAHUQ-68]|uniref:TlpA family protein disulfide reductase n=1 Tax=Solitalea agri TaxID=2953739 RepID=A0A9X2F5G5_9SPHI|nr:TlpA family protein disulfide reductase [Solitalea agri]MCO4294600.1 TlpA family protein disulfide reductase [Solitalea agri]